MTDSSTFLESVEAANQTPLSRLGSSKSLYAATDGSIEAESVLQATADAEYAAWQTFDSWAEDEANPDARDAFETLAADERSHYDTVTDRLDAGHEPPATPPALHTYLREQTETIDRLGAVIGRTLASDRSKSQVVGFFVGDADPRTASLFREFGDDLDGQLELTLELLETVCTSEQAWDRAQEAATGAIETAYGEYVETLEEMGANPKPVC